MTKFLLLLLSLLFLNQVCAEVTPSSYDSEHPDEDLHQNQIPPPNLQPDEGDVKHAILQLVEDKIDTDHNNKLSVEEMREWLQVVHQRIIDDNVDRQWAYYGPTVQEVHSWEGYTPETKEVLGWDTFKKVAYPDDLLKEDPSNPNYEGVHKLMRRSESRWNRADLNSDTVLTKDEFKGFVHPEEVEKLQTVLVDEALEDMDTDNDTLVTLDEYFNHLTTVVEDAEKSDPNWKQVSLTARSLFPLITMFSFPVNVCWIRRTKVTSTSTWTRTKTGNWITMS